MAGRKVRSIMRRGKYLLFVLDGSGLLVIHLGMSGSLVLVGRGERPKHERIRFEFSGGRALSFADVRTLGKVIFCEKRESPLVLHSVWRMGLEPIQRGFGPRYLADRFRDRKAPVKSLLLDQRVCCGVGNIYANEALYRAGVRPTRAAGSLSEPEVERLSKALRSVINDGIKWCGTTLEDDGYRLPDGGRGKFQRHLAVYDRAEGKCRCGGTVKLVRQAGRSSYYCPACQH